MIPITEIIPRAEIIQQMIIMRIEDDQIRLTLGPIHHITAGTI